MTKFFTTFACLLLTCSMCNANLSTSWLSSNADTSMSAPSPAPTLDCQPTIDEVMGCLPFLTSNDSKPDEVCCSAVKTAATTNIFCLCAIIGSNQIAAFRAKAMTIPSGCGMKSPFGQCDLPSSPAPTPESPVPIQAPLKGSSGSPTPHPEPEPIKSPVPVSSPSVPNRKPQPEPSPVSSPSVPSPKQGPSETLAAPSPSVTSTAPAPAPKKSPAAPTAYPISISVIAISSILFAYFC